MLYLIGLPGGGEWIFIILGILILFGGKKIPELMRGMGQGIREFNNAKAQVKDELEKGMEEENPKATSSGKSKIIQH